MSTEVYLVKELNKLGAADPISSELLQNIKQGEQVKAVITRPRNSRHHRKLFALLNVVLEAQTQYTTTKHLLSAIKAGIGYGDKIPFDGGYIFIPDSISYANADQNVFERFYNSAMDYICTKIIPGVNRDDLERHITQTMGSL